MPKRKWLLMDASFALGGAVLYVLLFDFLTGALALPVDVVRLQLFANAGYAVYGFGLYLLRTERAGFFRFLISANLVYAFVCASLAVFLFRADGPWGSALLAAEAAFIAVLASFEMKWFRVSSNLGEN